MTYTDYFLRFASEAAAMTLLTQAGIIATHQAELGEGGNILSPAGHHPTDGVSIYHVGVIQEGGEWDEEGNEIVAPTVLDGWHVNLRLREALTERQIAILGAETFAKPNSPVAVFG